MTFIKVLFMGTPEFAVPSLKALIEAGYPVVGVYTQPDKPKGRGYKLLPTPVKEVALQNDIPVFQPAALKTPEVQAKIRELAPDLIVVVAYGKILPKAVLDIPPLGCVNVHASLLPKYRGAGPIQWSILNGEKETGVTTMYMAEGLDTGDMILQSRTPILPDETAGELHDRLSVLGAQCLIDTCKLIEKGEAPREKQRDELSSYAPMLDKSLCPLDFNKTAREVHDQIRGLSPWPVACTTYRGRMLKLHRSHMTDISAKEAFPGTVLCCGSHLLVFCSDYALEIDELQLEGGKRLSATEFLCGHSFPINTVLGR